ERRPIAQCILLDEHLFHERAVCLERLDPVVGAVADIQQTVIGEDYTVHRGAELLAGRILWIVGWQLLIVGLMAIGAPVALIFAGIGIVDDHTAVAIPIRDV